MKPLILSAIAAATLIAASSAAATPSTEQVGYSPWGPGDEVGALNKISSASTLAVLSRINSGKVYELNVECSVGMPSDYFLGQPRYQIWNVHTPQGTIVDEPASLGKEKNGRATYSGSAISMHVHTGAPIDALSHVGLNGLIHNGHRTDEQLGDRGWRKAGVEKYPPIIDRGVLLDVAKFKGVEVLPAAYGITVDDLKQTAAPQAAIKVRTPPPRSRCRRASAAKAVGFVCRKWFPPAVHRQAPGAPRSRIGTGGLVLPFYSSPTEQKRLRHGRDVCALKVRARDLVG